MQKLSAWRKFAYGTGAMAHAAKDAAFVNFVMFFYTQVVGVSGTLAGLAAGIAMASDAFTDPIMGSFSDSYRNRRWGRRHPFMAASGIPLALCFLMLFMPPAGLGEFANFLWLTVSAVALRTCLTLFAIPHAALGAELSSDYEERSMIVAYRTVLGWLAGIALPAFAFVVLFTQGAESGDDGRLFAPNYARYGFLSALVALGSVAFCTWSTRSEIPNLPMPADPKPFNLTAPFVDMWEALRNRNFAWIFLSLLVTGAGSGVAISLALYVNTYFWEFTTGDLALFALPSLLGMLVGFAIVKPLGHRFEKRGIFLAAVWLLIANGAWWIPGRLLNLLPPNDDPMILVLGLVNLFFTVVAVVLLQIMGPSMVADVVDEHDIATGARVEGVFFAALSFSTKAVTGFGSLLAGVIIDFVGLAPGAEPGAVPEDVLFALGLIAGPGLAAFFVVPIWLIGKFDLDRERHAQLQRMLGERPDAGTRPTPPP